MGGGAAGGHHPVADRLQPGDRPGGGAGATRRGARADARTGVPDARRSTKKARSRRCPPRRTSQPPSQPLVDGIDAGYFDSWVGQQVIARYGAERAYYGGLQIHTTLDLGLQRAAEQAVAGYLPGPEGPTAALVAIENSTGQGARDGRRARATTKARSTSPPRASASRAPRSRRSTWRRRLRTGSPRTRCGPPRKRNSRCPTQPRKCSSVHNDENAYSGSNTLTGATAYSDNSIYAEVGLRSAPTGSPRLAHRMGITTPISTNPAMTIGGLNTWASRRWTWRTRTRRSRTAGSGSAARSANRKRRWASKAWAAGAHAQVDHTDAAPRAAAGGGEHGDRNARDGARVRHGARGRARAVRGRQDRHDLQLRRRVVRGLGPPVHGGGVGRLPQRAGADDHRVRRRPGARRHLPGADLAQLHGGAMQVEKERAEEEDAKRAGTAAAQAPRARSGAGWLSARSSTEHHELAPPVPARPGSQPPPAPPREGPPPSPTPTSPAAPNRAATRRATKNAAAQEEPDGRRRGGNQSPAQKGPAASAPAGGRQKPEAGGAPNQAPAAPAPEASTPKVSGGTGAPTGGASP